MALTLNDSSSVKKAPTGPNPQNRTGQVSRNTTGYPQTQPGGVNQQVSAPGAAPPAVASPNAPAAAAPTLAYDYPPDPILQQVIAQQNLAIAQAQDDALAQKKAALIAYGDPNLAMSVLGDKLTAEAAANNPGSTLAQLAATNQANVRTTNENENKANLFYSSDAAYQLGLAQKAYQAAQASAAGDVQSKIGTIGSNLLAAQQAAYNAEIQAQQDAYNRAINSPALGVSTAAKPNDQVPTVSQPDFTNPDIAGNATSAQLSSTTAKPTSAGVYPATTALPLAIKIAANKSGASANKTQGVFAIH